MVALWKAACCLDGWDHYHLPEASVFQEVWHSLLFVARVALAHIPKPCISSCISVFGTVFVFICSCIYKHTSVTVFWLCMALPALTASLSSGRGLLTFQRIVIGDSIFALNLFFFHICIGFFLVGDSMFALYLFFHTSSVIWVALAGIPQKILVVVL